MNPKKVYFLDQIVNLLAKQITTSFCLLAFGGRDNNMEFKVSLNDRGQKPGIISMVEPSTDWFYRKITQP